MATLHRKTAKGVAEMETRAHRLPPRLRGALILVDGKRSDTELRSLLLQQPDETLAALREQGFIEVAAEVAPPASARPVAAPAPAAVASKAAAGATAAPGADFERLRRDAVRTLNDLIGPASDTLAIRMERSRDLDELRPLLLLAVQSVANMRGRQAAADYAARFGAS